MSKLDDITLGDLSRGFVRYRPFVALVAAIALVITLTPGQRSSRLSTDLGGDFDQAGSGFGTTESTLEGDGTTDLATGGESDGGPAGTAAATGRAAAARVGVNPGGPVNPVGMVANCDGATGRVKIPSVRAPFCVPAVKGNAGATYRGVTGDKIKVAIYRAREDPATAAVLTAAGVNDSEEAQRKQMEEWIQFYEAHFEQYGRKIEYFFVPASGDATDTAAANADAQKVIDSGAFASIDGGNNTYVDKLAANGVMCFCTVSQPIEAYLGWRPFVWSTLMASSQAYIHRAEYIGKRLAGKNAKWAGEARFQNAKRVFGLVYFDTDDKAYKPGVDFFEQHLREKYGVPLKVKLEYHGYPNVARSQAEAGPLIQRLKDEGVSNIICACDPFGPVFFTKEATKQLYYPEWLVVGSALTDTSFFGRTYDPDQWKHAFGISFLTARLPEALSESYRLLKWHYGREPAAPGRYSVLRGPFEIFFQGVHNAGPTLTPTTFRDGMFKMPPLSQGKVTVETTSYGKKGIWPWEDYLAYDDVTEVWWDPNAEGEDDVGQNGRGLYRYVDGGRRYLPTQHPQTDPKAFVVAGSVTIYDKPPESDRWPDYAPPGR